MSRYVNADALIERWNNMSVRGRTEFDQEIMVTPTIDIVRCKECKWCDNAGKKRALICTNPYIDVDPNPNFFCGYGEREGE
jgi:hypothetical protein